MTVRQVAEQVQRIWRGVSAATVEEDLAGPAGAAIVTAVTSGQSTVAGGAQAYVAASMAAQGGSAAAEAALVAAAFTGIAPDGGPLETLLFLPAIGVRTRLASGATQAEAMLGGLSDMARYATTSVSDTARSSDQVAMTVHPKCVAYTRVVTLPACSRCIILAGQTYSRSEGFQRHPNCDCQVLPLSDAEWQATQTPEALYRSMDDEQRRKVFGIAGAEALSHGADLGQVVNARRGMSVAQLHGRGVQITSEGTTRRGVYGRQLRKAGGDFTRYPGQRYSRAQTPRLTPAAILQVASSRSEQLSLLKRYGYVT